MKVSPVRAVPATRRVHDRARAAAARDSTAPSPPRPPRRRRPCASLAA